MNKEGKSINYNFEGDFIQQTGSFIIGVDKSSKSNHYDVKQAGAVGSNSQNVVFDRQSWYQDTSELRRFLFYLQKELSHLSLAREALDLAIAKISDIEAQINSENPNTDVIKASGNVLYGTLLGVAGNLATKLLELLSGLNL
jgi:hypothetical protein